LLLRFHPCAFRAIALLCTFLLAPGDVLLMAQDPKPAEKTETQVKLPPDQLDSLVAPIALYPDPLLAQVLAASTYPLELVQLYQWLGKHKDLKDKALADAVKKESWDPSVQAMAALPDVVKQLAENIKWTSELGDAFLAQQSDVMDAVQRMRGKAKDTGKLKSNEQIKVETKVVESKSVVVIEQSNPQVVYVPTYNPTVVWGAPVYAYPPVAYPPAGYYAAGMAISFGVGVAMGAMWSGGWGYGCGWGGHNEININNNNNFNRNANVNRSGSVNRANVGSGNRSSWQHNPQHRGGAPYGDRATARQYGGTTRGDSLGNRQASARQNVSDRGGRADSRGDSNFGANRGSGGGNLGGSGGGDRIGNRQTSGSSARSGGAFGGSGGGGGAARASSSRGASSFGGSRGGGGGSRGGGRRR
jgi:hypothetical protein